jgi:hypothetical protein
MNKLFLLISLGLIAPICEAAPKQLNRQNNVKETQTDPSNNTPQKKVTWKQKISKKYAQTKDLCKKNSKKIGCIVLLLSLCALPIVRQQLANNWHARIDRQLANQVAEIHRQNNPQIGFENQLHLAETQAQADEARIQAERSHIRAAFWIGR